MENLTKSGLLSVLNSPAVREFFSGKRTVDSSACHAVRGGPGWAQDNYSGAYRQGRLTLVGCDGEGGADWVGQGGLNVFWNGRPLMHQMGSRFGLVWEHWIACIGLGKIDPRDLEYVVIKGIGKIPE